MEENTLSSKRQIMTFSIIMAINFPLYLLIWHVEDPRSYHGVALRLIATALCVVLGVNKYWPTVTKKLLPLYWHFVALFTLPFFFVFMTLKNNAATLWLMNLISALFFVFFLFDFISAIIILILGSLIAVFSYLLTNNLEFSFYPGIVTGSGITVTLLAAIAIGGLFSRTREILEDERLNSMKLLGSSIAHELRTPLASINGAMNGLIKYFPALLDAYEQAKRHNLEIKPIREIHYKIIKSVPETVVNEINYANRTIDMLLLNVSQQAVDKSKFIIFSAIEGIQESIDRYPFQKAGDRDLIQWNKGADFKINGDKNLFIHVIFNLLKNALFYIHGERKGEITIWLEKTPTKNIIYFRDTAKGIPSDILQNLFKRFYTRREGGTGIGLAYCKMAIESFNGKITCDSVLGEYTEFKLIFPAISGHQ